MHATELRRPVGQRPPPRDDIERPLPQNLEAERSILGAVMLDNSSLAFAKQIVTPADFFLREHRLIFRCMLELAENFSPIDLVFLKENLARTNELDTAGGVAYLQGLADGLPRATNIEHYARIVKNKALQRSVAFAADAVKEQALEGTDSVAEILERAEKSLAQFRTEIRATTGKATIRFRTAREIAAATPEATNFLAFPLAIAGSITEVVGPPKRAGKTTLAFAMIHAILTRMTFLGRATMYTPVMLLTEQPDASLRPQLTQAGLLERDDLVVLQRSDVMGVAWRETMRETLAECARHKCGLLVVDTLPPFAGLKADEENQTGSALDASAPLQEAAALGIGVIIVRHERKAGGSVGESGRGNSAFTGVVDTVVQLRRPEGRHAPEVRELNMLSRFQEIPETLMVEYIDGVFVSRGNSTALRATEAAEILLANAPDDQARAKTLTELIGDAKIKQSTAQRAIAELCRGGALRTVECRRKGRKRLAYHKNNTQGVLV